MKQAYVDKRFQSQTTDLIYQCNEFIAKFQRAGYVLTLRQLYYQLVAAGLIENNIKSYNRVGDVVNNARLAGIMDWDAIEDRTRNLVGTTHWGTVEKIIDGAAASYRIDKWEGQEFRPEIWVEKEALAGIVQREANLNDVDWLSCRGYMSQSEMHEAAMRFVRYIRKGQTPVIIHLGDHDPSGIDMTRDIKDRMMLFVRHYTHRDFEVDRIALNMNQIEQYEPPPNPAKVTDSRFDSYEREFGDESWELDALQPQVISSLIKARIERYKNQGLYSEIENKETKELAMLDSISNHWSFLQDALDSNDSQESNGNAITFVDSIRTDVGNAFDFDNQEEEDGE